MIAQNPVADVCRVYVRKRYLRHIHNYIIVRYCYKNMSNKTKRIFRKKFVFHQMQPFNSHNFPGK